MTGIELIAKERKTHNKRGYNKNHDSMHSDGSLADTAAIYACTHRGDSINGDATLRQLIWGSLPSFPYQDREEYDWCTTQPDRVTELVKAGALIAAEIDRLQSLKNTDNENS